MVAIRLGSVSLDCADPAALAAFWAELLGGEVAFSSDDFVAVKLAHQWLSAVRVEDYAAPTWPTGAVAKQIHLDLAVDDLAAATATATRLGATRAAHQPAEDRYVVLLDPAGHPFCLTTQIPED
ncbi:MAG: VOC family protein [Acidimicrobiales bacterium]